MTNLANNSAGSAIFGIIEVSTYFSLVSGEGDDDNHYFKISNHAMYPGGLSLLVLKELDKDTFSIRLRAENGEHDDLGVFEQSLAIKVKPSIHVSKTGSDISGDGSESKPFESIQHAIDSTKDYETVLVLPGTYKENINFNGKNITVASKHLTTEDKSYIESTIIDGDEKGSVVTFKNGEDTTAVLNGFTVQNGSTQYGGGIKIDNNSTPNISYLSVKNNKATSTHY